MSPVRHNYVDARNKFVHSGCVCTRCKQIVSDEVAAQAPLANAPMCNEVSMEQVIDRIWTNINSSLQPAYG